MGKSFYDLKIWQKGYELLMKVYEVTLKYPQEERYALISDTRRSANSIIANIAEAHGRYYFADKMRVLYIARGEVEEVRSHLRVGLGCRYLRENDFNFIDQEYEGLVKGISGYIIFLEKQKSNSLIN